MEPSETIEALKNLTSAHDSLCTIAKNNGIRCWAMGSCPQCMAETLRDVAECWGKSLDEAKSEEGRNAILVNGIESLIAAHRKYPGDYNPNRSKEGKNNARNKKKTEAKNL